MNTSVETVQTPAVAGKALKLASSAVSFSDMLAALSVAVPVAGSEQPQPGPAPVNDAAPAVFCGQPLQLAPAANSATGPAGVNVDQPGGDVAKGKPQGAKPSIRSGQPSPAKDAKLGPNSAQPAAPGPLPLPSPMLAPETPAAALMQRPAPTHPGMGVPEEEADTVTVVPPESGRGAGMAAPASVEPHAPSPQAQAAAQFTEPGQAAATLPAETPLPGAAGPVDARIIEAASSGITLAASTQAGLAQASLPQATLAPAPSSAAAHAAAPAPAQQLAPALVALAHGPSGAAVTLRLDPAELGHVQVRIERDTAGAASIQVTAERPETLRMLTTDQPQLHRVLDGAGLPTEGRSLTFTLDPRPAQTPQAAPSLSGGTPGGSGDAGGQSGGGQRNPGRTGRGAASLFGLDDDDGIRIPPAWRRAGVDITA